MTEPAKPVYDRWGVSVYQGDNLDILRTMPDASIHSIVTDPPAGIAFMSKNWDENRGGRHSWVAWLTDRMEQAYRVLKPGGHALVWAMPRTSHWTAWALEDAGFEVRDCIVHLFGAGFPKSLDVGKAIDRIAGRADASVVALKQELRKRFNASGLSRAEIDRACGFRACNYLTLPGEGKRPDPWVGVLPSEEKWAAIKRVLGCHADAELDAFFAEAEREVIGTKRVIPGVAFTTTGPSEVDVTAPATDAARQWEGWGTSLKPSQEMWWLCRKPLSGTVSATVLEHGTGALNIDGCRVDAIGRPAREVAPLRAHVQYAGTVLEGRADGSLASSRAVGVTDQGRWPSNVVLTHSADCGTNEDPGPCVEGCPVLDLDRQSGRLTSGLFKSEHADNGKGAGTYGAMSGRSRDSATYGDTGGASRFFPQFRWEAKAPARERPRVNGVAHPTCKSVGLMRWMTRLITPPGGMVLDLFAGTGTTGQAARAEGFSAILIENDPASIPLIVARLDARPKTEARVEPDVVEDEPLDLFSTSDEVAR